MELWVVYGGDHDYDCMSQWLVGVYSSEAKAEAAAKRDKEAYWKSNPGSKRRGFPNIQIIPTVLDVDYEEDN